MNPIFLQGLSYRLSRTPIIAKTITRLTRRVFNFYLSHRVKSGKGFVLGCGDLGFDIYERKIIGDDCQTDQNVTIGGTPKKYNIPKLGNHAYGRVSAKTLGPISVGDNVVIVTNTVVVQDISSVSLVEGVPVKIIKSKILKSDYV